MDVHAGELPKAPTKSCQSITILGSTGTIGQQTLDVVGQHKEAYTIEALTAQTNVSLLAQQAIDFQAKLAVIGDVSKYEELKSLLSGSGVEAAAGEAAIVEATDLPADCYMAAIVGVAGLAPTYAAAKRGTRVALANKECLVSAGSVFMKGVGEADCTLIPVDSEHSAVFQALDGSRDADIRRMILTASGGPFRTWGAEELGRATVSDALCHPTWNMGQKITIDSASMMNKGLELIEAFHLFPVTADQLEVIVHPQSIVHGLVEFDDGSSLAQLGVPDMRVPIAYSLAWPARITTSVRSLSVADLAAMTFEAPDEARFPALRIAKDVLNEGAGAGAIFNAANEVAVECFLSGDISFMSIASVVESTLSEVLSKIRASDFETLEDVLEVDRLSRTVAGQIIEKFRL